MQVILNHFALYVVLFLNVIVLRFIHGHVPGAINVPYTQTITPEANNTLANFKGCRLTVVMGRSSENESRVSANPAIHFS